MLNDMTREEKETERRESRGTDRDMRRDCRMGSRVTECKKLKTVPDLVIRDISQFTNH